MPANFLSSTLVLIPARNASECIASTVREWRAVGAKVVRVVDNASTDQTSTVAANAGAEVIVEPRRGYGVACSTGLSSLPPGVEWIAFSSASGSDRLSADDISRWDGVAASGTDLIIGERCSLPEARANLKPAYRLGNALCCAFIWLGWGRLFRDIGSLRLIHRNAFQRLDLQERGFGWNIEMQVRALELDLKIVEMPVHYRAHPFGPSKASGTVFGIISAAGLARSFAWLWLRKFRNANEAGGSPAACRHSVADPSPDMAP